MIEAVVAFVVLLIPLALWLALRWRPNRQKPPKEEPGKPRHRWWQP